MDRLNQIKSENGLMNRLDNLKKEERHSPVLPTFDTGFECQDIKPKERKIEPFPKLVDLRNEKRDVLLDAPYFQTFGRADRPFPAD